MALGRPREPSDARREPHALEPRCGSSTVKNNQGALAEAKEAFSIAEATRTRWGQAHSPCSSAYRPSSSIWATSARRRPPWSMRGARRERAGSRTRAWQGAPPSRRCYAEAGDGERALALAERGARGRARDVPPAASVAFVALAEARMRAGDLDGAREVLKRVDGAQLAEPDRTFSLTAAGLAGARAALACGDPSAAASAVEEVLALLRANDVQSPSWPGRCSSSPGPGSTEGRPAEADGAVACGDRPGRAAGRTTRAVGALALWASVRESARATQEADTAALSCREHRAGDRRRALRRGAAGGAPGTPSKAVPGPPDERYGPKIQRSRGVPPIGSTQPGRRERVRDRSSSTPGS